MQIHLHTFVFLFAVVAAGTASAFRLPYTAEKFRRVMDLSKLQEFTDEDSDGETYLPELRDYASRHFHLMGTGNLAFKIHGDSRRSELRERTADDENAAWSITDSHTMTGKVAIPKQAEGLEEITFLQIHCDSGALVRLSWVDEYSNPLFDCVDCTIANVRQGNDNGRWDGDVPKFFLSNRHENYVSYTVTVEKSLLSIWVDGQRMVDKVDVSFWEDEPCYFKAGAYNNHPDDDESVAVMKFSSLEW